MKFFVVIAGVVLCFLASCSLSADVPAVTEPANAAPKPYTAKWNDVTLAESFDVVEVEGNKYFPMSSLKMEYFKNNSETSTCFWKGKANYFDIVVDGKTLVEGAWYYAHPKRAASNIKNRVAFWMAKGVTVK